jgi:hypothetical protein
MELVTLWNYSAVLTQAGVILSLFAFAPSLHHPVVSRNALFVTRNRKENSRWFLPRIRLVEKRIEIQIRHISYACSSLWSQNQFLFQQTSQLENSFYHQSTSHLQYLIHCAWNYWITYLSFKCITTTSECENYFFLWQRRKKYKPYTRA